jgi:hypothetical protein
MGDNSPPALTIGAGAEIIQTQVNTLSGAVPAEYVQGDWSVAPSFTLPAGDSPRADIHNTWTWNNGSLAQRLRWQQNNVFIAFYYQPYLPYSVVIGTQDSNPEWVYLNSDFSQAELLQIASGMLPYSATNPVVTGYLPAEVNSFPAEGSTRMSSQFLSAAVPNFTPGIQQIGMIAFK